MKKHSKKNKVLWILLIILVVFALLIGLVVVMALRASQSYDSNSDNSGVYKTGKEYSVLLGKTNPSVGEGWQIKNISDQSVIKDANVEVRYDESCKVGMVGCSGEAYLAFTAAQPGETTVDLEECYRGNCEKVDDYASNGSGLIQEKTITIRVE